METLDLEPGAKTPPKANRPRPCASCSTRWGDPRPAAGQRGGGPQPAPPYERFDAQPQPAISTTELDPDHLIPFALRDTCPVRTDHRNYVTVSFWLHNVALEPALLVGVQGHPPLGGLSQEGPALSGGTCKRPGRSEKAVMVEPESSRLYTVRWKLPDACPEPYPLEVRVTYQRSGQVLMKSGYVTVLVDMGGIGFVQCPKAVPDAFPTS